MNSVYLERLKLNLAQTLGLTYELLVWDNLEMQKPITEVYNMLASRAQYPYWCFIHEDIRFETKNWAGNLLKAFEENPGTGLIGIAGAKYKSATPSGWSTGLKQFDVCNIYHQDKDGRTHHIYMNPHQSIFEPVVNVDGVFMAIRREVWRNAHFNAEQLRGFHLYDIDFSFHILKNWKAAVVFNIDIMHFTQGGNYGNEWLKPTISWHRLFSNQLPQSLEDQGINKSPEKKIAIFWLKRLSVENISATNKWKWIRAGRTWMDPAAWPFIGMFLIGKKARRRPKS